MSALSEAGSQQSNGVGTLAGSSPASTGPVSLSAVSEGVAHRLEERHPGNQQPCDRAGVAALPPSLSALSEGDLSAPDVGTTSRKGKRPRSGLSRAIASPSESAITSEVIGL